MRRVEILALSSCVVALMLPLGCGGAEAAADTAEGRVDAAALADVQSDDAGAEDVAQEDTGGAGADDVLTAVDGADASPAHSGSAGCGLPRAHPPGGVQVVETFSAAAGGERSYFLSVPASYDPEVPQRLIIG